MRHDRSWPRPGGRRTRRPRLPRRHAARPGPRRLGRARTSAVVVGTSAGSGVGALLRAGLPPADFAARVLNEPLSAEGARVVANAPRPVRSFDAGRRAGRWPRPAAPEGLARAMLQPWRLRPGHLMAMGCPAGTQPTTMIGDRIRAVYQRRRQLARRAPVAVRAPPRRRPTRGVRARPEAGYRRRHRGRGVVGDPRRVRPGRDRRPALRGRRRALADQCRCRSARARLDTIVVVSPMSMRFRAASPHVDGIRWWCSPAAAARAARGRGGRRPGRRHRARRRRPPAMGLSIQAMDGTRMEAVTRQAERSAASLLAKEAPLG